MNLPHNTNRCVALLSKRHIKEPLRALLAAAGKAALLVLLPATMGCVAYVRPAGEWNEPVDLDLDDASLKGMRVKVDCVLNDGEGQVTPQDDEDCAKLRVTLGNTGARILLDTIPPEALASTALPPPGEGLSPAERAKAEKAGRERVKKREKFPKEIGDAKTEKADFRVNFVAFPTSSDHCGKSVLLFLFTFGLGPCLEDIESHADLYVTDVAKGVQIRKPLVVRVRRVLGASALALLLIDIQRPVNRKDYRRLAGAHLLEYVQNVVFTFAMRDRFEAQRPRVAQDGPARRSPKDGP